MVEAIYELKNRFVEKMRQGIAERGIERVDVNEMYQLADIVKDLAEAEKSCWEAEYYRSVTDAMDNRSGYQNGSGAQSYGMGGNYMGYSQTGRYIASDGRSGYRDSMGRYAKRMGYSIDALKAELQNAEPHEREAMMQELRQIAGM